MPLGKDARVRHAWYVRFVPFWAALWLALSLPIQAAAAVALRAPQVITALNAQLKIIGPMAPSTDIAAHLWATYSPRLSDPNEAVAGQILLRAIERPDALPQIAAALDEMTPGGRGAAASRRLDQMVGRYQHSPEALRVLQDMVAPLDGKLARSSSRHAAAKGFEPLSSALFDGTKRIPSTIEPPSSTDRYRVLSRGAASVGAGRRNFGLTIGKGAVQPSDITPAQAASLTARLAKMKSSDGPRVLTERELSALHAGRAPDSDMSKARAIAKMADANFTRAAVMVNRWVAEGKDLELGMLIDLNRTLRRGLSSW
ncbi:MAG: hypothetical protein AAB262_05000, partial [Elusimicrobiota bacterium]